MKRLSFIDDELHKQLGYRTENENLERLGFKCKGHLCEYNRYENFNKTLLLWVKEKKDIVYTLAVFDLGGSNSYIFYKDLFIEEICC